MRQIVELLEADLLSLLGANERLKHDFLGLSEHIGIDPQEALVDAVNHWVGQNAEIFNYPYGTDLSENPTTKEIYPCPTPKN